MITTNIESDGHYQFTASIIDSDRNKKYIISAGGENMYRPQISENKKVAIIKLVTGDGQYFYSTIAIIDLDKGRCISTVYLGQGQESIKFAPDETAFYWGDYRYEILRLKIIRALTQ